MAIGSIKPPTLQTAAGSANQHQLNESEQALRDQERFSRRQVKQLNEMLESEQREANHRLDTVKEQSMVQMEEEKAKQEDQLARQQEAGYKRIQELRRRQQKELNRIKRDGDKAVDELQSFYDTQIYQKSRETDVKMKDQHARDAALTHSAKLRNKNQQTLIEIEHQQRMDLLKQEHDARLKEMGIEYEASSDQTQEAYLKELKKTKDLYEKRYADVVSNHQRDLTRIYRNSSGDLKRAKMDTSSKLAAYSTRNSDPFYQIKDLGAQLDETDQAYVLKARIPKHEQRFISVSVKGDGELVLTGQRRNRDQVQTEGGGQRSTASFQSFSETFRINGPVDATNIEKDFEGDTLIVRVPKRDYASYQPYRREVPARTNLEKPRFPNNLPVTEAMGQSIRNKKDA